MENAVENSQIEEFIAKLKFIVLPEMLGASFICSGFGTKGRYLFFCGNPLSKYKYLFQCYSRCLKTFEFF